MGNKKKKPSNTLKTIAEIINILAGITSIISFVKEMLKG